MNVTSAPGTYALLLDLSACTTIIVGRLGSFEFPAGYYVYTGSAFGPGGLAARVGRHLREKTVLRWHIDFFTLTAQIIGVAAAEGQARLECAWAQRLLAAGGAVPVRGFGSSDCREGCPAHLVYFAKPIELAELQFMLGIEQTSNEEQILTMTRRTGDF